MGRSKRHIQATADESALPPDVLSASQMIVQVLKACGNNLYSCSMPDRREVLVELPSRFRNAIWIRRGGFVVMDSKEAAARENKIDGEIVNVVRDEKAWRKQPYWPKEFVKASSYPDDSDDEESVVGRMPPSDSEDE